MLSPPFPLKIKIATQEEVGKLSRISVNYMRRKVSVSLDSCHGHLHATPSTFALVALPFAYTLNAAVESLLCFEEQPHGPFYTWRGEKLLETTWRCRLQDTKSRLLPKVPCERRTALDRQSREPGAFCRSLLSLSQRRATLA